MVVIRGGDQAAGLGQEAEMNRLRTGHVNRTGSRRRKLAGA